jgi:discoidin domain receptor family protein 2
MSIYQGKFSTKSDVWSFGVTLWEILTLCRTQPFHELDDRAVIDNCRRYCDADGSHMTLPRPPVCPSETYDLMCQCWTVDRSQRPSFHEIHMFLQRKNLGYSPEQDIAAPRDLTNNNDSLPEVLTGDVSSLLMMEPSVDYSLDNISNR